MITGVGVIALILAVLAGIFGNNSNKNAINAEQQRNSALSAQATAQSDAQSRATAEAVAVQERQTAQNNYLTSERSRLAAIAFNSYDQNQSGEVTALLALRSMLHYGYSPEADGAFLKSLGRGFVHSQFEEGNWILDLAFLPEKDKLLVAKNNGNVGIWDGASGTLIRQMIPIVNIGNRAALSPDGTQVVTCDLYGKVILWDATSGQQIHKIAEYADATQMVEVVTFSPTGRSVATAGFDKMVHIWDIQTGEELQRLIGHGEDILAVKFSPDGKFLLSGSLDKTLILWDVQTGAQLRQFTGHTELIIDLDFSPDGQWIVSASHDKTARTWETATGKAVRTLQHDAVVRAADFSPDGRYILTGALDGIARLWDTSSGAVVKEFVGHKQAITSAAYSLDGKQIVTGGDDGSVKIWDVNLDLGPRLVANSPTPSYNAVQFSPDAQSVLLATGPGTMEIIDVSTGKRRLQLDAGIFGTSFADFSADGKLAVTANCDRMAILWDLQTGKEIRRFTVENGWICLVQFSPDGRYLATENQQIARVWEVETGRQIHTLPVVPEIWAIDFSPDGKYLATAKENGGIWIWDIASGSIVQSMCCHNSLISNVDFSPDGKTILSAGENIASLWSVETGQEIRRFSGLTGEILSISFSHDGKYIATGSDDKTARIWDVATGQEARRMLGDPGFVTKVKFSADDAYLYIASANTKLPLFDLPITLIWEWRVNIQDQINQSCVALPRDFTPEESAPCMV